MRAVSFWNYQMNQENIIQTTNMKKMQEKLEQAKINVETMDHQFKKLLKIESKQFECKYNLKKF